MKDIYVYNAVCYDGVESYVIKVIAVDDGQVREELAQYSDLEVLKVDKLHTWNDLAEHIKGAIKGNYDLADGNKDLANAIYRYIEFCTGLELM
jgi:uncharacterized protein YuzB (UPF0349 family)